VIKYLGSKRRLVPVLGAIATAVGARTAADVFTGTTRVAQEFKQRGAEVWAVDLATYAHAFARCYIETDARLVDMAALESALAELSALPGVRGYVTEVFCEQARFFQPKNGERIDAIRDRLRDAYSKSPLYPILLTSLVEAADRVDSTTGLQMAYLKKWAPRAHLDLKLRVPELLQPAPLLHQLPLLGNAGPVGRSRPLRRRLQAGRCARRRCFAVGVQLAAHDRRGTRGAAGQAAFAGGGALLQRRVVPGHRRPGGLLLRPR
jgi:hypothetical protein